jgi:hypothetical protein
MLNIKIIINFFFNLLKKKNRFSIATTKNFKNNYYANDNFNIKFSKIKKKDRDLIYKYLSLTDTKNGAHNFLNWGGGNGVLDLLINKINPKIKTTIIEKENFVKKIKSNSKIIQKFEDKSISFSSDQNMWKSDKFKIVLFFGSLCYMPEIYNFFKFSKSKYIAISRLPMLIDSKEDIVAYDDHYSHYETFLSEEKFKKIYSKSFKFLYFSEHWGGLKKNKSKIDKYEIKSCDILLERKIL